MKRGLVIGLCAIVLGGCGMTTNMKMENGLLIQEAGQTNMFRPSLSVMQVSKCVPEDGITTVIDVDGSSETCYGRFMPIATVQGTQAGSMSGIGSAAIQGGAIIGGAYLLADGIRDSGSRTTNNNTTSSEGGDSLNNNSNTPYSISNSGSTSSASQMQVQKSYSRSGATGGSVVNKGHHR